MTVPDMTADRAPYLQVADELRRRITTGQYKVGDRLPGIPVLADEFGMSGETIRRAQAVLRTERVIVTQGTRGSFVRSATPESQGETDPAALAAQVARLRDELRADLGRVEANLISLYGKTGYNYPHGEVNGAVKGRDAASRPA
jgi:DNA-binding FadR family transcriptional regulator